MTKRLVIPVGSLLRKNGQFTCCVPRLSATPVVGERR